MAEFCPLQKSAIDPGGLNKSDRKSSLGEETTSKKTVPQLKSSSLKAAGCSPLKISSLRNANDVNLLKLLVLWMDCKSTYAGSIPTSASTNKQAP
ncbi:hypothetical protein EMIT0P253_10356 [Pseudomonas sp. IT-P253]